MQVREVRDIAQVSIDHQVEIATRVVVLKCQTIDWGTEIKEKIRAGNRQFVATATGLSGVYYGSRAIGSCLSVLVDKIGDLYRGHVTIGRVRGEQFPIKVGLTEGQVFEFIILLPPGEGLPPAYLQDFYDCICTSGKPRERVIAIGVGDGGGFIRVKLPVAVLVQVNGPPFEAWLVGASLAIAVVVKPLGAMDFSEPLLIAEVNARRGLPRLDRDSMHIRGREGLDPTCLHYFGNGVRTGGKPRERVIATRVGDGGWFIRA